ncbi:hypothetical protein FB451DRAFT_1222977 [Mycena latifolia]|nr:hypothetical protein FB451DRAFT_1222977 [Mycena latifolia]
MYRLLHLLSLFLLSVIDFGMLSFAFPALCSPPLSFPFCRALKHFALFLQRTSSPSSRRSCKAAAQRASRTLGFLKRKMYPHRDSFAVSRCRSFPR